MNSSDNRRSLLLSAALGVTCGVIAGAAMIACREKEKPKAIPVAEVGIAKPTSPSAIRSRIEEPVLANDRAAVDSLLREHPDARPIARDQAHRFVGDAFIFMGLKVNREGTNPLRLSEYEMDDIDRCLSEACGKTLALEAASARLASKTETEMVFEIPARGLEREKILRDLRVSLRKSLGPLRGEIIADWQEGQPFLGHAFDDRTFTIERPLGGKLTISLEGTTPEGLPNAGASWTSFSSSSIEAYPELLEHFGSFIDFEDWNERTGTEIQ